MQHHRYIINMSFWVTYGSGYGRHNITRKLTHKNTRHNVTVIFLILGGCENANIECQSHIIKERFRPYLKLCSLIMSHFIISAGMDFLDFKPATW